MLRSFVTVSLFALGVLWSPRAAKAQELAEGKIVGPSHWALGVSGGAAARPTPGVDGELDSRFHGALGVTAMLREVQGPLGLYATGVALPLWAQVYSARAGFVLGIPSTPHYSHRQDYGYTAMITTYAERVRSVFGLLGGGGFMASSEGLRPHAEFGIGWMGIHHLEASALLDPGRGAWGGRLSYYQFIGRGSLGGFFGMQLQGMAGAGDGHPALFMALLEFGLADGLDMD